MSTNLPPLPDKVQVDKHLPTGVVIYGYTKESMRAYGAACANAAFEAAEKMLNSKHGSHKYMNNYAAHYAMLVRELKGETL